jgi:hypothetical protein
MQNQYRQNRDKKTQQITPKTVWPSLTDRQQERFRHTIERICQQLATRVVNEQEGHDAAG